jgi:hypothetical protein
MLHRLEIGENILIAGDAFMKQLHRQILADTTDEHEEYLKGRRAGKTYVDRELFSWINPGVLRRPGKTNMSLHLHQQAMRCADIYTEIRISEREREDFMLSFFDVKLTRS